jgi:hypothetical protein
MCKNSLILILAPSSSKCASAVWPVGGPSSAITFFQAYLAAPVVIALGIFAYAWKVSVVCVDYLGSKADLHPARTPDTCE